jgi:hypothetical protein
MATKRKGTKYKKARLKEMIKEKDATLLPAKVRVNPRTGKVQVFVSPKVAAQVKGNRNNPAKTYQVGVFGPYDSLAEAKKKAKTLAKYYKQDVPVHDRNGYKVVYVAKP